MLTVGSGSCVQTLGQTRTCGGDRLCPRPSNHLVRSPSNVVTAEAGAGGAGAELLAARMAASCVRSRIQAASRRAGQGPFETKWHFYDMVM